MPQVLVISVDTTEGQRRFGVLADALKDLAPVLKEFDQYKRAKIAELFETEGHGKWPPRSERSEERGWARSLDRAKLAETTVLKKLRREYGRALFRSKGGRTNAVARRGAVLAEFERQMDSGTLNVGAFEHDDRRLQKSVRGLDARLQRARARAQARGRVLGALPQTVRSAVRNGLLTIDSSWDSPAVRALNDGAVVGNNAKLEPRTFFEWEPADVEYLVILFRERAMLAWRG